MRLSSQISIESNFNSLQVDPASLVSKKDLNLMAIAEQYRNMGKAARGAKKILNAIKNNDNDALQEWLGQPDDKRDYSMERFVSKTEIDSFLKFFSLIQLCILTNYVSQPLFDFLQQEISIVLGNKYVKTYYEELCPNLLLQKLYHSILTGEIQHTIGDPLNCVELLWLDRMIDDDIVNFQFVLDAGKLNGCDLNDFKLILRNEKEIEKILFKRIDERSAIDSIFRGFFNYSNYIEKYVHFLQIHKDNDLLSSALWHFQGDLFKRMHDRLNTSYKECILLVEANSIAKIKSSSDRNNIDNEHLISEIRKEREISFANIDLLTNPDQGRTFEKMVQKSKFFAKKNSTEQLSHTSQLNNKSVFVYDICFLYIGTDSKIIEYFSSYFEFGYYQETIPGAIVFLQNLSTQHKRFPDVIFIDLPFNRDQMIYFNDSLQNNFLFARLPIIYSEKQLADSQMEEIRQLDVVDDVMSIDSFKVIYDAKVNFLKKSKRYAHFHIPKKEHSIHNSSLLISSVLRRCFDFTAALLLIILFAPILLLIALIIKLESKGPIIYTAPRAGKGFRIFKFYKFRSMKVDADKEVQTMLHFNQYAGDENGATFVKFKNDPRVTKIGKILRNTSADELPQLFNVLKGDMSLVGNRPLPLYEAEKLTTNEFVERFNAPAGITGLWQVNKRGKADMSTEERINLDIVYSKDGNFLYDLKILAQTPVALYQKSDV